MISVQSMQDIYLFQYKYLNCHPHYGHWSLLAARCPLSMAGPEAAKHPIAERHGVALIRVGSSNGCAGGGRGTPKRRRRFAQGTGSTISSLNPSRLGLIVWVYVCVHACIIILICTSVFTGEQLECSLQLSISSENSSHSNSVHVKRSWYRFVLRR